ncbi:H-NS family nucleoid-associated regulatory protein [Burkholderia oklahomensis]|uniref:H-NS histone family protein n=1 Tax=Burkholderia oklahomensis TaxID=342113 RepID=A0AAI8FSH0_9BURK|nr:H-NS histone family protein [Burkholderia oklahomensis]AIO70992.1 H-NS histone family protein [Burkholderia oklahomensis]AJX33994.1 H-NS histone family protein [Burkholderia oklahomensis C6786]AOI38820.1 H-NS histone [Burkholderia oklahomensis EO147]AOI48518.1 H-NS histone [Burkholderia oklahomensis C6786]KUY48199.1 H-NS histone [Burkholderia oklahomensis C6786]
MATYKELKARADALSAQVEAARQAELQAAIDDVRAKVLEYGITAYEVFGYRKKPGERKRGAVKPKYRDPVTGAIWTGRGIEPKWIRGRDRDEFLIE